MTVSTNLSELGAARLRETAQDDARAERFVNWVPDRFVFGEVGTCFYCGSEGDSLDHCIPIIFLSHRRSAFGIRVWACRDCNHRLSNAYYPTLAERCAAIRKKLTKKLQRTASAPQWTEKELSTMGHGLKSDIRAFEMRRRVAVARLAWQDGWAFQRIWGEGYEAAVRLYPENRALHGFMQRTAVVSL